MIKQTLDKLFYLSTTTLDDVGAAHRRVQDFIFVFDKNSEGQYRPYPSNINVPYCDTMEEAYKYITHYYHGDSYVPVPGYYDK